jgi:hypothetical protein
MLDGFMKTSLVWGEPEKKGRHRGIPLFPDYQIIANATIFNLTILGANCRIMPTKSLQKYFHEEFLIPESKLPTVQSALSGSPPPVPLRPFEHFLHAWLAYLKTKGLYQWDFLQISRSGSASDSGFP